MVEKYAQIYILVSLVSYGWYMFRNALGRVFSIRFKAILSASMCDFWKWRMEDVYQDTAQQEWK
jgi:hypothetical protein